MSVISKQLHIGGMTCAGCQYTIERKLGNTAGVHRVSVSYNTGIADITYDTNIITLNVIEAIITKLGYEILTETGERRRDIKRIAGFMLVIIVLYVLLQQLGILNLLVPSRLADTKMGYGMLFVIGLVTSVHCIGMCGGINISQCIPQAGTENDSHGRLDVFKSAFMYNLGRVISYTVIGVVLGFVGMLIGGDSGEGLSILLQGVIKIIAGLFMVIMGVNMLGILPWLGWLSLRMPKFLSVRIEERKFKSRRPLIIGLLNGLMPCGPLQSMQIVAVASGNPFAGGLAMLMFSLGTVPLMLGLGSLVSALGKRFSQKVMSIGAVLVVVLGLAMLSQGGSLSGLLLPDRLLALIIIFCAIILAVNIPSVGRVYKTCVITTVIIIVVGGSICCNHLWNNQNGSADLNNVNSSDEKIEIEDGIQVISSTLEPGRYPDITVQVGIPVKWVIDAPSGSINGCNYKMLLSEYGIEHEFAEGENIIEFTPEETGTVQYTCWMGMIYGNIIVVDND